MGACRKYVSNTRSRCTKRSELASLLTFHVVMHNCHNDSTGWILVFASIHAALASYVHSANYHKLSSLQQHSFMSLNTQCGWVLCSIVFAVFFPAPSKSWSAEKLRLCFHCLQLKVNTK